MRNEQLKQSDAAKQWDTVLRIAIWPTWVFGCIVGVVWFWLLAATNAIGPITPDSTASARYFINAAATVSVIGAITVVTLATALLIVRRGSRPVGAMLSILVALFSPWAPLQLAMNISITGE